MSPASRFKTTISAIAIVAVLSGCAAGQANPGSPIGSNADLSNVGLATKALASLQAGQATAAVDFAERAVEATPGDAGFRALLGNCYFAAGRFASAEQAYRDSLTLAPNQPKLLLKLALVEIAQGKDSDALALLDSARNAFDPADYGLAIALAGRPADAVAVLNQAARADGADARVRQNLALAYGLSGDWAMARTVASQDVPPDQLDSRIQQWMAMATPTRPSDQVAALTGVTPAVDPGQPVRLALNPVARPDQALAQADVPQVQPQPQPQAEPVAAPLPVEAPPAEPAPMVAVAAPVSQPEPAPMVAVAAPVAAPEPQAEPEVAPNPVVAEAVQALIAPVPAPEPVAEAPVAEQRAAVIEAPVVPAVAAKPVPQLPTRFEAPQPASYVAISDTVRRAAANARRGNGKANSVVQLGAYSSPERVNAAWRKLTKRYPALASYTPMRARFNGPKGTVWRLSIKGFDSRNDAVNRCELLQNRGGNCFVRTVAGDSPVQFASR